MNLINFRDLGNTPTTTGRKIKPKRLLRSADLNEITDNCANRLIQEYNLKKILDLRTPGEADLRPNRPVENALYLNIDVLEGLNHEPMSSFSSLNEKRAKAHMKKFYEKFLYTHTGLAKFFREVLNNQEGSVLFHCAHGKDRTGFGAALILKALEVDDNEIYSDYLKTVKAREAENQLVAQKYRERGFSEEEIAGIKSLFTVEKDYLIHIFTLIEEKFGNFENYFTENLGITENEIIELRINYLD